MRSLRRMTLILAVIGTAPVVQAADLPSRKSVPLTPVFAPTPFSWTGFRLGAHGGYATGHDITREFVTATWTFIGLQNRFRPDGFYGGLHGGFDYQFGNVVLGVESDIDIGEIKGGFVDPPAAPFNPGGRGNTKINIQGSGRLRAGYAFDRLLAYGTGGIAMANIKSTYSNWPGVSESFTRTLTGYTVGGGLEYAVTDRVTIRSEYRFTEFAKIKNHSQVAFPGFSGTQHPRYHNVSAGVTYKF